jgi:hypothetical protein
MSSGDLSAPAFLLANLDIRVLDEKTISAIIGDLRGDLTGRPKRTASSFIIALEDHLRARVEAAAARERAAHAARLQRQEAAERQRVAEQEAANNAVAEVRRQFAQKMGLVR